MSRSAEVLEVSRAAPGPLVDVVRRLHEERDGWVNLQARVDDDEVPGAPPARAGIFNLFTGRGPAVPVVSYVPSTHPGKASEPDSLGIQHPAGPKALDRLADAGIGLPGGWRKLADHPKRGLVVALPADADPGDVLRWAFVACDVLAGGPLPDAWVAIVHRR